MSTCQYGMTLCQLLIINRNILNLNKKEYDKF